MTGRPTHDNRSYTMPATPQNLSTRKPRVLTFTQFYQPGFRAGGPIKSITNLVEALGDEIEFYIVTSDRDLGSKAAYDGVSKDGWQQVGKAKVTYISPNWLFAATVARIIRSLNYDTLYLNSFWSPMYSTLPLIIHNSLSKADSRVVLAPRGEFSTGALAIKPFRKRAFLGASIALSLHTNVHWEASSDQEKKQIEAAVLSVRKGAVSIVGDVSVIGNISSMAANSRRNTPTEARQFLKVIFLSRISPMKNLDFAINAMALVKSQVQFTIVGPTEDIEYAERCAELLKELPRNISVVQRGPIPPDLVPTELSGHDLLFLPTRGENFGHVIIEALQAGLRVLISDQTPWRNLEQAGVGFDIALDDPAAFARAIDAEAGRSDSTKQSLLNNQFLDRILRTNERIEAARKLLAPRTRLA
jgi:glycosyltransferase involved in cell wall biosynthesis